MLGVGGLLPKHVSTYHRVNLLHTSKSVRIALKNEKKVYWMVYVDEMWIQGQELSPGNKIYNFLERVKLLMLTVLVYNVLFFILSYFF